MTIGQKIKQRREALGLTQDELAKKVGYASRSSINKIELSRDLPLSKVSKMATALETSPSFLMGWTDNPDPNFPFKEEVISTAQENLDKAVGKKDGYYLDPETAALAQKIYDNKYIHVLLDAADGSRPEDITMVAEILVKLKGTNPNG